MSGKKPEHKGMSEFELGSFFSKLETKMDGISHEFRMFISKVEEAHNDHEKRIRAIEKDHVSRDEHETLKKNFWRITVFLAASGAGGTALYQFIGG